MADIDAAVAELQKKAEELGEQGDVDSSMACINEADELKSQRDQVIEEHRPKARRGLVCPITGATISENDRHRLEDGRMFLGWKKMRQVLAGYEANPPPAPQDHRRGDERRSEKRDERRDERRRSRSRDHRRSERRSRSPDRRRDDRRRDDRRSDSRRDERRRQ